MHNILETVVVSHQSTFHEARGGHGDEIEASTSVNQNLLILKKNLPVALATKLSTYD